MKSTPLLCVYNHQTTHLRVWGTPSQPENRQKHLGGRDTTHNKGKWVMQVWLCLFWGSKGVPHSPRWVVWWSKAQRR